MYDYTKLVQISTKLERKKGQPTVDENLALMGSRYPTHQKYFWRPTFEDPHWTLGKSHTSVTNVTLLFEISRLFLAKISFNIILLNLAVRIIAIFLSIDIFVFSS